MRRRRPVPIDGHSHRDHLARLDITQFGPGAAIDRPRRQVKQQVDDARRIAIKQPSIKFLELRSNPGEARERGK
jgi:hypothetical protein